MTLLTNARILTMDAGLTELNPGWLRTEGSRIAALGEGTPPAPAPGEEVMDCGGDIVMPGMVNSHCHLTMTLFRGLGEDVAANQALGAFHVFFAHQGHDAAAADFRRHGSSGQFEDRRLHRVDTGEV